MAQSANDTRNELIEYVKNNLKCTHCQTPLINLIKMSEESYFEGKNKYISFKRIKQNIKTSNKLLSNQKWKLYDKLRILTDDYYYRFDNITINNNNETFTINIKDGWTPLWKIYNCEIYDQIIELVDEKIDEFSAKRHLFEYYREYECQNQ